jgi:hypothetical protein
LESSEVQAYNSSFLCLGGRAAQNWWRKLEIQYGDSTIAIRLTCFLKHKPKDPKGKEEEVTLPSIY